MLYLLMEKSEKNIERFSKKINKRSFLGRFLGQSDPFRTLENEIFPGFAEKCIRPTG